MCSFAKPTQDHDEEPPNPAWWAESLPGEVLGAEQDSGRKTRVGRGEGIPGPGLHEQKRGDETRWEDWGWTVLLA